MADVAPGENEFDTPALHQHIPYTLGCPTAHVYIEAVRSLCTLQVFLLLRQAPKKDPQVPLFGAETDDQTD